jgi:septal ring factor EnvC (AmiA/AmiB activator)
MSQIIDILLRTNRHLAELAQEIRTMKQELQDLADAVKANTDATAAAVQFIDGLATQMQTAIQNEDGPAIEQLANDLKANTQKLAEHITANTPADKANAPVADPAAPAG